MQRVAELKDMQQLRRNVKRSPSIIEEWRQNCNCIIKVFHSIGYTLNWGNEKLKEWVALDGMAPIRQGYIAWPKVQRMRFSVKEYKILPCRYIFNKFEHQSILKAPIQSCSSLPKVLMQMPKLFFTSIPPVHYSSSTITVNVTQTLILPLLPKPSSN
ncbi:hypothetical protein QL285_022947 [Trifolium repens]|nr:hypothetical protein QL285_022947 [Trifolium repens]